ncbi:MAG: hypothetical protein MZV63_35015 [Marinilabiliales bacterium]|nr:hypothetical protein [Marinilabiliales bacterium]
MAKAVNDRAAENGLTVTMPERFTALPGYGVEAYADGTHILAGNRRLMEERKVNTEWAAMTADQLASEGRQYCISLPTASARG